MALTPVVAYHRGARDFSDSAEFFQMVWLALIASAAHRLFAVSAKPILEWIGALLRSFQLAVTTRLP